MPLSFSESLCRVEFLMSQNFVLYLTIVLVDGDGGGGGIVQSLYYIYNFTIIKKWSSSSLGTEHTKISYWVIPSVLVVHRRWNSHSSFLLNFLTQFNYFQITILDFSHCNTIWSNGNLNFLNLHTIFHFIPLTNKSFACGKKSISHKTVPLSMSLCFYTLLC